jgi:hypothetical protein
MLTIETVIEVPVQIGDNATSQCQTKANHIADHEKLILSEIAECDLKVVCKHGDI